MLDTCKRGDVQYLPLINVDRNPLRDTVVDSNVSRDGR